MDKKNRKVKFFTKDTSIILGITWGLFIIIIYLRKNTFYDELPNIITLFTAFLAFTGIIYSNYRSDKRNENSLTNSNEQLIEQLTRDKKRKSNFHIY